MPAVTPFRSQSNRPAATLWPLPPRAATCRPYGTARSATAPAVRRCTWQQPRAIERGARLNLSTGVSVLEPTGVIECDEKHEVVGKHLAVLELPVRVKLARAQYEPMHSMRG